MPCLRRYRHRKIKTRTGCYVVRVDEADRRLAVERHHITTLKVRVVVDRDVVETRDREETIRDAGE